MNLDNKTLKEILFEEHYVSAEDLDSAMSYASENKTSILVFLYKENVINRTLVGQAIGEHYKVNFEDIKSSPPPSELINRIPQQQAIKLNTLLIKEDSKSATLVTNDPSKSKQILDEIGDIFFNKEITISFSFKEDIAYFFNDYRQPLQERFQQIIKKKNKIASEIIDEIVKDALIYKSSDIHLEPLEHEVIIRYRIDGILQEAGRISKEHYESILNRIKVKAYIRTDEHYNTQDGAIRMTIDDKAIDLRISIVPILDGEKIVIRILSQYIHNLDLRDLGLTTRDLDIIKTAAKRPFGMILVTGPTGSGKTTTLYSILKTLHTDQVNITTIEDPVEYKIPGINQIQVNAQTNLTFAKGLRSIIRQDPNIILVGEIRDRETAEIAVNASLTGHLLLSTFHANNASTAIPRLLDMGIEPFLLSSTLNMIISQRLMRKICQNCRNSYTLPRHQLKRLYPQLESYFSLDEVTLYQSKGCNFCNSTGYKDRFAIFELIYITPEMQELMLHSPSMAQVAELAYKQGASSFFDNGMEKVKDGLTSLEELLRVAPTSESAKVYGKDK